MTAMSIGYEPTSPSTPSEPSPSTTTSSGDGCGGYGVPLADMKALAKKYRLRWPGDSY